MYLGQGYQDVLVRQLGWAMPTVMPWQVTHRLSWLGRQKKTWRVNISKCVDWVNKRQVVLEDGCKHRIKVPGKSHLFIQVAGSEVIADGVMTCQGEN